MEFAFIVSVDRVIYLKDNIKERKDDVIKVIVSHVFPNIFWER